MTKTEINKQFQFYLMDDFFFTNLGRFHDIILDYINGSITLLNIRMGPRFPVKRNVGKLYSKKYIVNFLCTYEYVSIRRYKQ